MPTTIKKIETKIPACPFTREGCTGACCACWNDDWGCCSVSAVGIYHQMREAATDAAVEVIGAYKEKDVTQRTVPVILEGQGEGCDTENRPRDFGGIPGDPREVG